MTPTDNDSRLAMPTNDELKTAIALILAKYFPEMVHVEAAEDAGKEITHLFNMELQRRVGEAREEADNLYRHVEKLRHAVEVNHWSSYCGNCRYDRLTGIEKNCPRCKWSLQYVYTQYIGEEELAHKVFPHLELIGLLPELKATIRGRNLIMGRNFISVCHACEVQLMHLRGKEGDYMQRFANDHAEHERMTEIFNDYVSEPPEKYEDVYDNYHKKPTP